MQNHKGPEAFLCHRSRVTKLKSRWLMKAESWREGLMAHLSLTVKPPGIKGERMLQWAWGIAGISGEGRGGMVVESGRQLGYDGGEGLPSEGQWVQTRAISGHLIRNKHFEAGSDSKPSTSSH